jgi:hypothetical protein
LVTPLIDNGNLLEMYETFKEIEGVYNNSMIAMGLQGQFIPLVSSNTNVSLSHTTPVSTR